MFIPPFLRVTRPEYCPVYPEMSDTRNERNRKLCFHLSRLWERMLYVNQILTMMYMYAPCRATLETSPCCMTCTFSVSAPVSDKKQNVRVSLSTYRTFILIPRKVWKSTRLRSYDWRVTRPRSRNKFMNIPHNLYKIGFMH